VYTLLNEIVLSYLAHFVVPSSSCDSIIAAASALCPNHSAARGVDYYIYSLLTEPLLESTSGFDNVSVECRIKSFLVSRCESSALLSDDAYVSRLCRAVEYIISEVLELASCCSIDCGRRRIVPLDIRLSIFNDEELMHAFQYCKVFWYSE
jgi:histone H3/H4